MEKVKILDYGSSNLRSVVKAFEYIADKNFDIAVADNQRDLLAGDRVVFPGQGAIGQCMQNLVENGFKDALRKSMDNKPFLGLCLGLQSLLDVSEEDGGVTGLGIIPGRVTGFPRDKKTAAGETCKIPHMGWNQVIQKQAHPLWKEINSGERFYFVHSFYVEPEQQSDIAGTTEYITEFTSAVARDNLFAVQFHPEKSQQAGMTLLKNFLYWNP